jgi:tripartite-type tricarboxylate transporter receptor subunit TctC
VQVIFSPVPESIEHIRAGKLRPLAVMSGTRLELLPDLPTVGDFLSDYETGQGIGAPKNTPVEIIDKLNAINVALYEKLSFEFVRDIAPVGRVESVHPATAR